MISAIIVAGGKGVRMGKKIRKQYLMLRNLPVLSHTLLPFDECSQVDKMFLVAPEGDIEFCQKTVLSPLSLGKEVTLVPGGAERQESVYNGLLAVSDSSGTVLIHDGVRPFVRPELISHCVRVAEEFGACIPAIPVSDTLKRADDSGNIERTLDRKGIWLAQTPQAFQYGLIMDAHEQARTDGYIGTDDASLVERLGKPVRIINGSSRNIKITTPEDLRLAEGMLSGYF